MVTERQISLRLPSELLARIEALAAEMAKRNVGVEVARSSVVRLLLERGLEQVEPELGLSVTGRRRSKRR